MPICHGYWRKPSNTEMQERMAMFPGAFTVASFVEEGFVGHYFGPEDGYHDAGCAWLLMSGTSGIETRLQRVSAFGAIPLGLCPRLS